MKTYCIELKESSLVTMSNEAGRKEFVRTLLSKANQYIFQIRNRSNIRPTTRTHLFFIAETGLNLN